jgi:hypothetical protein
LMFRRRPSWIPPDLIVDASPPNPSELLHPHEFYRWPGACSFTFNGNSISLIVSPSSISTVSWSSLAKSCLSLLRNPANLAGKGQFGFCVYAFLDSLLSRFFEQSYSLNCLRRGFGLSWISVGEPRSSHILGRRIGMVSADRS